jgi:hypothetical protein
MVIIILNIIYIIASIDTGFGSVVRSPGAIVLGLLLYLVSMITLFVGNLGKTVPHNYILLFIFVILYIYIN